MFLPSVKFSALEKIGSNSKTWILTSNKEKLAKHVTLIKDEVAQHN